MPIYYRFTAYFTINPEPAMYKDFDTLAEAENAPSELKHLDIIRYQIEEIEVENRDDYEDEKIISRKVISSLKIHF